MTHYHHPSVITGFLNTVSSSLKTAPSSLKTISSSLKAAPSSLKTVVGALLVMVGSLMAVAATAASHSAHSRTTINTSLQHLAERMMRGKQGSIVAIDPATGEIKCMVSASPRGDSSQRAVSVAYSPGSTFKVAQAIAMLSEGTLSPTAQYSCARGFTQGGIHIGCHAHTSPRAVVGALGTSCNAFFCKSFMDMIGSAKYRTRAEAIDRWHAYMSSFGLGRRLGTDVGPEAPGLMPSADYLKRIHGQWAPQTIMWVGMGQGEVTATPMQLCNLAAVIANRGYYYTPHLCRATPGHPIDSAYRHKHVAMGTPQAYQITIQGMRAAVVSGTCASINRAAYAICGKTGTAENEGEDHSLFIGFAPMDKPRIAVAVVVDNGGFGADMAAPIASLIIEQYLTGRLREYSEYQVEQWASQTVMPYTPPADTAKAVKAPASKQQKTQHK